MILIFSFFVYFVVYSNFYCLSHEPLASCP